jgi:hypothetical protein
MPSMPYKIVVEKDDETVRTERDQLTHSRGKGTRLVQRRMEWRGYRWRRNVVGPGRI